MAGSDRVAGIHSEIKYRFDAKSITNLRKFKRDLMELKTNMAAIQKMAKKGVNLKFDRNAGKADKAAKDARKTSDRATSDEVKRSAQVWKMREKILRNQINEARIKDQASQKEINRAARVWRQRTRILSEAEKEARIKERASQAEIARAARVYRQRMRITEEARRAARATTEGQKKALAMEAKIASQRAKLRRIGGRAAEGGTATPSTINRITRAQEALNRAYRDGSITSGHFSTQSSRLTAILQRQSTAAQGGTRSFNQLRTSLMAATGAYSAFAGLANIKTVGGGFEDARIMLETAFGGTDEAESMMDFLIVQSKRLGIEAAATAKGFARYSLAGKEMGFTNEQLQEQFLGIAEAGAVFGLRQDEVTGVLRAMEQIA